MKNPIPLLVKSVHLQQSPTVLGDWTVDVTFGIPDDSAHDDPTITITIGAGLSWNAPEAGDILMVRPPEILGHANDQSPFVDAEFPSKTPETAAIIRDAMKSPTMTETILAAKLTLKCEELERDRNAWKANHDNQVELKRIIAARPDLAERAPMVEKLMHEKRQAEFLNVAFHMRIRKLESAIRKMDAAHGVLPENRQLTNT